MPQIYEGYQQGAVLTGTEIVPMVQDGQNIQATSQELANLVIAGYVPAIKQRKTTSDFTKTSNDQFDIIDNLSIVIPALPVSWRIEADIYLSAGVGGVNFTIGAGLVLVSDIIYNGFTISSTTINSTACQTTVSNPVGTFNDTGATYARITGTITGELYPITVSLQFAQASVNPAASTVLKGSTFTLTLI